MVNLDSGELEMANMESDESGSGEFGQWRIRKWGIWKVANPEMANVDRRMRKCRIWLMPLYSVILLKLIFH